jgi:hypothetical protein
LRKGFSHSTRPRVVEIPLLSVLSRVASSDVRCRYELQSHTLDVRG